MSSFSYAVPKARRTDRLSDTFASRFPTSMPTASSCSQLGHAARKQHPGSIACHPAISNSRGAAPTEQLAARFTRSRVLPVRTTQEIKERAYSRLAVLLDQRGIVLPAEVFARLVGEAGA